MDANYRNVNQAMLEDVGRAYGADFAVLYSDTPWAGEILHRNGRYKAVQDSAGRAVLAGVSCARGEPTQTLNRRRTGVRHFVTAKTSCGIDDDFVANNLAVYAADWRKALAGREAG